MWASNQGEELSQRRGLYDLTLYIVSLPRQTTPTSSACTQLCLRVYVQFWMPTSSPLHRTSSSKIGPVPWPKAAFERAIAPAKWHYSWYFTVWSPQIWELERTSWLERHSELRYVLQLYSKCPDQTRCPDLSGCPFLHRGSTLYHYWCYLGTLTKGK